MSGASPSLEGYRRGLSVRMIRMMAVGGAIGTGLFYGTGTAIHDVGPALLLVFAVAGLAILVISRALGELLDYRPTSGSLYEYPREFLGGFAGFLSGWTYWVTVSVGCAAEATAAGKYLQLWWPAVPVWAAAFGFIAALALVNLASAKVYGETEFWFAGMKAATILALIVFGVWALLPVPQLLAVPGASVANLWRDGGIFPNGSSVVFAALPLALFAYAGVEQVGLTAGEARDAKRTLRKAVTSIPLRIALFYLGALAVLLCLRGWRSYQPGQSPFVAVFLDAGVPFAAGVVNFVVLTAAASSCNASMYSTARLLRAIALRGEGPRPLGELSARRVPAKALAVSALVMALAVGANLFAPQAAWSVLISLATIGIVIVWGLILASHLGYRRAVAARRAAAAEFRLPLAPWSTAFAGLLLASVLLEEGCSEAGRAVLAVGVAWVAAAALGFRLVRRKAEEHPPREA
ncbi:amino acid permease-associated region [Segniliparus rotundus DSM 44985]|uniref:Amino acid permease-associated region n=1 Tax=Segniliparus rotundus (strain ATCC BAA-972 / CDC 1076 / CIP 108378 / DSM 44985 / JCM 13578) TaxID=640132 RepID=D6ZEC1_SEGRD|nr:amino acid permease [Segniliparus rotundus]ADG99397.1 amino acid permease-associated region [Segniliparus rotundus DSM 44985]